MAFLATSTKERFDELKKAPVLFCKYENVSDYDDHGMFFTKTGWFSCDSTIDLFISKNELGENPSGRRLFIIGKQLLSNGSIDENKEGKDIVQFEIEEFSPNKKNDWCALFIDCAYNFRSGNKRHCHMSLFWALYTSIWTIDVVQEALANISQEDANIGREYIYNNLSTLSHKKQSLLVNILKNNHPNVTPLCYPEVESVLKELSPESSFYNSGFFEKIDFIFNFGSTDEEKSHLKELFETSNNKYIHFKYWFCTPGHKLYDYSILETIYSYVEPGTRLHIVKRYLHDVRLHIVDIDYNLLKNFRDIRNYSFVDIRYFIERPGANIDMVAQMFCDAILTLKSSEGKKIQDFNGILDFAVTHSNITYPSIDLGIKYFLPSCDGGLKPNSQFNGFVHYSIVYKFDQALLSVENLNKTVHYILGEYAEQQYHLCCENDNDRGLSGNDILKCSKAIPTNVEISKDGITEKHRRMIKCAALVSKPWQPIRWKKKAGSDKILELFLSTESLNRLFTSEDIDLNKLKNSILAWAAQYDPVVFVNGCLPKEYERYNVVKHLIAVYCRPTDIIIYPKNNVYYASKKSLLKLWDPKVVSSMDPDSMERFIQRVESPHIFAKTFDALKQMYPNGEIGHDYIKIPYDETELHKIKDIFHYRHHIIEDSHNNSRPNYLNLKFLVGKRVYNTFYCTPKLADTNEKVSDLPYFWCRSEECFCNMLDNQTLEKETNWENYTLYHAAEIIGLKLIEETDKGNIPINAVSNFAADVRQAERLYSRLICRSCGHMIFSTRGSILNGSRFFSCSNPMCSEYRKEVYLSQCNTCKRGLIDSRDSKKCENGWVICPTCLSCCNDGLFDSLISKHRRNGYIPPRLLECEGKGHNNKNIFFCPQCALKLELITIEQKETMEDGSEDIVKIKVFGCPQCKKSYENELKFHHELNT